MRETGSGVIIGFLQCWELNECNTFILAISELESNFVTRYEGSPVFHS